MIHKRERERKEEKRKRERERGKKPLFLPTNLELEEE